MSNVGQVIADPDFGKLSPQEQQGVLSHFDPQFSQVTPQEFPTVIRGIRATSQDPQLSASLSAEGKQAAAGKPLITPKMQPKDPTFGDYASIAGAAAAMTAPEALGMLGKTATAATATSETAEGAAAAPKGKALGSMLKTAMSKGSIQGAETETANWKELTDAAFEASAEARHAGKPVAAMKYFAAALLGKFGAGYEGGFVKLAQATKGYSAVGVTAFGWYEALKTIAHLATSAVSGDDEEKK